MRPIYMILSVLLSGVSCYEAHQLFFLLAIAQQEIIVFTIVFITSHLTLYLVKLDTTLLHHSQRKQFGILIHFLNIILILCIPVVTKSSGLQRAVQFYMLCFAETINFILLIAITRNNRR